MRRKVVKGKIRKKKAGTGSETRPGADAPRRGSKAAHAGGEGASPVSAPGNGIPGERAAKANAKATGRTPSTVSSAKAHATGRKKAARKTVKVCFGTCCIQKGAREVLDAIEMALKATKASAAISVERGSCSAYCDLGPVVTVEPDGTVYGHVTPKRAAEIVTQHLIGGKPLKQLAVTRPPAPESLPPLAQAGFFKGQVLIAMRNRGRIDPDSIEDYMANDGYLGLVKALTEMEPVGIVEEVKRSGLRGRGGAGFPTGLKWEICRRSPSAGGKYIICNADEGDPGAFMDRSLLESDPHAVIEGMVIGARGIGADKGYIYVREEYPLALARIVNAIEAAREYGFLGKDILGTGFDFDLGVVRGAGAFVCGEETALMASIEGREGKPRPRPPFPAECGLWGKPTNINNVETWANVAPIILRGGDWYAALGTAKSKGTKVFSLVGKVKNTGLIEVPMGTTLREIIYDIGGGVLKDRALKAVQTGGPSGGCIPASLIDLPVDYEELAKAGSIMGSGGLIVMDDETCMVDVAHYFVGFLEDESCGKCAPCREGITRMREILGRIVKGEGKRGDIELLEALAVTIKEASLCGLGATAPNPVLTTLRYFRDEYEAHVYKKRCPARVCKALIVYRVVPEKCTGCQRCVRACPVQAISGPRSQPHNLDQTKCIKCGACYEVCKFDAIAGDAIYVE
jgi:NADH:ubiquinone oxidoreductase subunit F (NADH-binding)/(2Fe-2S) ferredoxin/NAD-dependent dihydropyrimidine dehydrogenase PreA subunit